MKEPKNENAAHRAWATRRSRVYKARRTSVQSREALADWCKRKGWHLILLDAASGNPRVGIIDSVMLRLSPGSPDKLEMKLVQLKGGSAGLTASEWARLDAAARLISIEPLGVLTGQKPDEVAFLRHHAEGVANRRRAGAAWATPGRVAKSRLG